MIQELAHARLTVGIMAVGTTEGAIENTISYTKRRNALRALFLNFKNTQFKLAERTTQLQIYQAFLDRCIELLIDYKLTTESTSMIKYLATDMCEKVVDECLQLYDGYVYKWHYPIARKYVDNCVARIYAGTNEIMKIVIARGFLKDL